MYRTFHSKVDWWYWLLMGVTAFLLLDFFWFHHTVILTEDGRLRIESGRFVPDTEIEIRSITGMRRVKSCSLAPALSVERIEIAYRKEGKENAVQVSPRHAGDFMAWVQKKMNADNKPNTE